MTSTIAEPTVLGPAWNFGDKLRKIRREVARVSQARMATIINVSASTYSAWEGGRSAPRPAQAREIARLIQLAYPEQVSAAWILYPCDGPIVVDTSYLSLVSNTHSLLPWMDSNHQPPDLRFHTTKIPARGDDTPSDARLASQCCQLAVKNDVTDVYYQKLGLTRKSLARLGCDRRRVDARGVSGGVRCAALRNKRSRRGARSCRLSGRSDDA